MSAFFIAFWKGEERKIKSRENDKMCIRDSHIAGHELVNYKRGNSKDRGEVYSLAYAAYHKMNYFCSKEIMVDNIAHELKDLQDIDIITFDIIVLADVYKRQDMNILLLIRKILKNMLKY